jgi:hypothetical protein
LSGPIGFLAHKIFFDFKACVNRFGLPAPAASQSVPLDFTLGHSLSFSEMHPMKDNAVYNLA